LSSVFVSACRAAGRGRDGPFGPPPHRSGRAGLPHPALTSGVWRRSARWDKDARNRPVKSSSCVVGYDEVANLDLAGTQYEPSARPSGGGLQENLLGTRPEFGNEFDLPTHPYGRSLPEPELPTLPEALPTEGAPVVEPPAAVAEKAPPIAEELPATPEVAPAATPTAPGVPLVPDASGRFPLPMAEQRYSLPVRNEPVSFTLDSQGRLTDGYYVVDSAAMAKHKTGSFNDTGPGLPAGRSQWFNTVDAEKAVLDAARLADRYDLWVTRPDGTQWAKVPANEVVGALGRDGTQSNVINVTRSWTSTEGSNVVNKFFLHGSPGTPR